MNLNEILNKSLAWLYHKDKKIRGINWDFSNQFLAARPASSGWLIGFESSRREEWWDYRGNEAKYAAISGNQVAPQELYILTQIILHTLNIEPGRFHHVSELPGLENRNLNQLEQLICYLVKQGWIEVKNMEELFLIKLSIQGKTFVGNHNHDAWA